MASTQQTGQIGDGRMGIEAESSLIDLAFDEWMKIYGAALMACDRGLVLGYRIGQELQTEVVNV